MPTRFRGLAPAAVATLLLTMTGCAGMGMPGAGGAGGGGGGGGANQALVEIQSVEAGAGVIRVRTEQGETGDVLFDERTVVVYQEQQYPVTALEYGDIVVMQLQQVQGGRTYTPRVDVRQSVQERRGEAAPGASGQVRLSGEVGEINRTRRSFEVRAESGIFTVILPADPTEEMVRRFDALQAGQTISVEGTRVGADGVQLSRIL